MLTFKAPHDPKDGLRGRQKTSIEIRKKKKDERISARRALPAPPVPTQDDPDPYAPRILLFAHIPQQSPAEICDEFLQCVERLVQDKGVPAKRLHRVAKHMRRETQKDGSAQEAMIQQLLQRGVPHAMVHIFSSNEVSNDDLCESTCILINATATTEAHVTAIAQTPGLIDAMAPHILHPDTPPTLCQQIIWCFGNFAGMGGPNRNLVFRNPTIVQGLVENLEKP